MEWNGFHFSGSFLEGVGVMNAKCAETLELLAHALRLMDGEGLHIVAARIAMAIDDLAEQQHCSDRPM
jgi:hypothetical protein